MDVFIKKRLELCFLSDRSGMFSHLAETPCLVAICTPGDGTLESWVMLTGNGNKVSFFSELML